MSNLDKHKKDYNILMFHSSKSAGIIYTLNQYVAEKDENGAEGEALSVNYRNYKYELHSEVKQEIVERISALLAKSEKLYKNCNCVVAVPSKRFKPIVHLLSDRICLKYIDALEKTESFYMKKIEPISERKKKCGFISCKYDFDDNDCILLIDDFVDSGSTFRECLKAIKEKNPKVNVVCISVFRTEKTQVELE